MRMHELKNGGLNEYYKVRSQLEKLVDDRSIKAYDAGDRERDAIRSKDEFESRRSCLREKFINALGGLPSSDSTLNARVTGVVQEAGFRIEKVIFESRPGAFVTANLYIPDGVTSPRGAVLYVCGHHEQAKHQDEYQIVCRHFVKAGLVVLAQDPVGQGERFSYYEKSIGTTTVTWGVHEHDYAGIRSWLLGDSIARYFVHDAMRGIDYLCSRPEVDPERIGVTGNSGGGTQTSLMMVCDPRVRAAAPATFIMNRRAYTLAGGVQDAEQIWPEMTALGFDHEDILLAMAPKPVLVLAVNYDFFPIEGTVSTLNRARRFWEMYGKADDLEFFADNSVHMYTPAMARKAAEFFSYHLNGAKVTVNEQISAVEGSLLWCTRSGQVRGEIEGARFVHEENVERLDELERQRSTKPCSSLKAEAMEWLKERVYKDRKPCCLNPRFYEKTYAEELQVQKCFWWSQEGLLNHAFMFRNIEFLESDIPVTIAVWDSGTSAIREHIDWIRDTCSSGRAVFVLDAAGIGASAPSPIGDGADPYDLYDIIFRVSRDLMWLDDSIVALRTYDVLRSLDMLGQWPGADMNDVKLHACGCHGLYGQLATLLDKRIKGIAVEGGIGSFGRLVRARHYNTYDISSVILPGILKYMDLDDVMKWIDEDR